MSRVQAGRPSAALATVLLAAVACAADGPGATGQGLSAEESALQSLLEAYDAGDCATVKRLAPGFRASTDLRLDAAAYVYGRCFQKQGDDAAAEAVLAPAADRVPANLYTARAAYYRAQAVYGRRDFARAEALFEVFLARFPWDVYRDNALFYRAKSVFQAGDWSRAIGLFDPLREQAGVAETFRAGAVLYVGRSHLELGIADPLGAPSPHLATARDAFRRVLSEHRASSSANDAHYFLGRAEEEAGLLPDALAIFQEHESLFPGSSYADDARYHGGLCLWKTARAAQATAPADVATLLDRAGQAFESVLRDFPASAPAGYARYWLGRVRYEQKAWAAALPEFEAAAGVPGTPYRDNSLYYQGMCRYHQGREGAGTAAYEDAIARFDALLAEFPGSSYADGGAYFRARCLFQSARWRDAAAAFEQFLERYAETPYRDDAWYQLVRSYVMAGDCAAAQDALARMRADVPGSPWLDNAERRVVDGGC